MTGIYSVRNDHHLLARTGNLLLEVMYNSSSLNQENHDCNSVWISDLNWYRFLRCYFCFHLSFSFHWEDIWNTQDSVWEVVKNALPRVVVSSLRLGVSVEMWSNTVVSVGYTPYVNSNLYRVFSVCLQIINWCHFKHFLAVTSAWAWVLHVLFLVRFVLNL